MMDGIASGLLAYASAHLLATLIVVPVACLALRTRAIAPEARAALLLVAFVLVVIGPAISLHANVSGEVVATIANASAVAETPVVDVETAPPVSGAGATRDGITIVPTLAALLLAMWLAGMAWALARLLVAHAGLRRIVAASHRSHALEDACRQVIPEGIEIRVSRGFGPAAIGIVRPMIVLPRAMTLALPADALRAVLLHEATHHGRNDVLVLMVQRLVEAVFWWNPLVRLLGTTSEAAREVACDIGAARAYGASTDYAEALLDSIAHLVPATTHGDARRLCAAASLSTLDQRIDAIIAVPRPAGWRNRAVLTGACGMLMLLCIGASLAAPDIAMEQGADAMPPVAMRNAPPTPFDPDALMTLHDRYSESVHANHDRYSEALHRLTESYTRELTALAEQPPRDGKDTSLARLNARYERLFSDNESRFRRAAAEDEATFLRARQALDGS